MREFYQRSSGLHGSGTQFVMGCVMIGLGVVTVFTAGSGGAPIGVGVVLMIVSGWAKRNPLIRLHHDRIELKLAALATRRRLLYREIDAMICESSKKAFLSSGGKRIRLPLVALEDHDRDKLRELLGKRIGRPAPVGASAQVSVLS